MKVLKLTYRHLIVFTELNNQSLIYVFRNSKYFDIIKVRKSNTSGMSASLINKIASTILKAHGNKIVDRKRERQRETERKKEREREGDSEI